MVRDREKWKKKRALNSLFFQAGFRLKQLHSTDMGCLSQKKTDHRGENKGLEGGAHSRGEFHSHEPGDRTGL